MYVLVMQSALYRDLQRMHLNLDGKSVRKGRSGDGCGVDLMKIHSMHVRYSHIMNTYIHTLINVVEKI